MSKLDLKAERHFLNSLVAEYKDQTPYSKAKKDVISDLVTTRVKNSAQKSVLQLGCSSGYETKLLSRLFNHIEVIDGSKKFIDKIKDQLKTNNVNFIYSLFEDFNYQPDKYDYIFCSYVLEHVFDPVQVLEKVKTSLKPSGRIFVVVPNYSAFSRQLARELGLVKDLKALTSNDRVHGHRRVYGFQELENDIKKAGYKVTYKQGVVFKILADFQLNKMLEAGIIGEEHIHGLQKMASVNMELCDSIFMEAAK